jgi:uncharacterized protein
MEWLIILPVALIAGTIGGVIGFGAGVIMVPILVWIFGAKAAVPIMAIAAVMANGSRVFIWWREVDWRAALAYSVTAVPFAILGASTYIELNSRNVTLTLGIFLLLVVPFRHGIARLKLKINRWHLSLVGAAIGFLTGLVASTGPVNAPFFLMYGLTKGAFLATEALGSVAVHITKTTVFTLAGTTTIENVLRGFAVGSGLMAGSFISKRIVEKMQPGDFQVVMDVVVVGAGVAMLVSAWRG